MKVIEGSIATEKVGSRCGFRFEVPDDTTPEEIEELAREAAFDRVDWHYTIDGEAPQ